MPRVHEGTATSWTFFFGVWTFEAGTVDEQGGEARSRAESFSLFPTLAIGVLRGRMGVVLPNSTLPGSALRFSRGKNVDEARDGGKSVPGQEYKKAGENTEKAPALNAFLTPEEKYELPQPLVNLTQSVGG